MINKNHLLKGIIVAGVTLVGREYFYSSAVDTVSLLGVSVQHKSILLGLVVLLLILLVSTSLEWFVWIWNTPKRSKLKRKKYILDLLRELSNLLAQQEADHWRTGLYPNTAFIEQKSTTLIEKLQELNILKAEESSRTNLIDDVAKCIAIFEIECFKEAMKKLSHNDI